MTGWHDNCPRCPGCGSHRHAGDCNTERGTMSPLMASLYRTAELMDEAASAPASAD
jgi:hypothetical protein